MYEFIVQGFTAIFCWEPPDLDSQKGKIAADEMFSADAWIFWTSRVSSWDARLVSVQMVPLLFIYIPVKSTDLNMCNQTPIHISHVRTIFKF